MERALSDANSAHRLIELSQRQLTDTTAKAKIEYERADGLLMLAHTSADLKTMQKKTEVLKDWGVTVRAVTSEEISKIEPGLQTTNSLLGAYFFPGDEAGNCRQFALHLKNELQSIGVQVHFEARVSAIQCNPHSRVFLKNQTTPLEFDHVVLCSGVDTRSLLQGRKIKMPMATISSYSMTARVKEEHLAPRSVVYNASDRTTIARLGNRIRVAYGAELGIPSKKHAEKSVQHLFRTLQQNFPGAAEYSNGVQIWKGAFGVMPDGLPVIGQSVLPNLWLNVGHGPNGWAMACGAARCIADAIDNRQPPIDITPYSPLRF
jgi:D-amino-acid dehydrogenase